MTRPLALADHNFKEEVLESKKPVLVDFWASWCPPCKMVEPTVMALAKDLTGEVKMAKINVDQNPKSAFDYKIMGVPTFIVFKGGEEITRRIGAQSKEQLLDMLRE